MDDVKEKVLYILEIDLGLTLGSYDDELELDSIDEVKLVMLIEEEFGIVILDKDVEGFTTPNKIMEYVDEKKDK